MNPEIIGHNLSSLRKQRGITQAELAKVTNVTVDHINHVENGISGMSLPLLLKICEYLGVKSDDILAGTYEMKEGYACYSQPLSLKNVDPKDRKLLFHLQYYLSHKK